VEAVDANGKRCPTFQKRVDFSLAGPAVWRGGYNSGKAHSINNTFLDLECGINRVAVRTTRTAGKIIVKATCPGLKSAVLSVKSAEIKMENGFATEMPVMPVASLPAARPVITSAWDQPQIREQKAVRAGKFITEFSYSGPAGAVHVESNAQDGKKILTDRDEDFSALPGALKGADYVQAAAADAHYNAVDLMEIAVQAGSTIFVAHDDRLALPDWLTRQFKPADVSLTVAGHAMKVFHHTVSSDESVTLGTNTENANAPADASMYIVFVKGQ
jgi:beta-galactosidase